MNEVTKMLVVLSVISGLSGLVLAGLREVTKGEIERQIIVNKVKPSLEAMFTDENGKKIFDNDPVEERKKIAIKIDGGKEEEINFFPIKVKGELVAVAFERAGKGGYGGNVGVLSAFHLKGPKEGRIAGIGITSHNETPGLGSRVTTPQFRAQFKDRGQDQIVLGAGGINALSGATKSSTATVDGVQRAVVVFKANLDQIRNAFK